MSHSGINVYTVRVGYADVDRMGFLHHACHVVMMESARTELIRTTGMTYRQLEERGILLPLTECHVNYKKPGLYDDVLHIETHISELTRLRVRFQYVITCPEREALIAEGTTAHVFMTPQGRPFRVEEQFLDLLRPFIPN